ncbi:MULTISPECIES: hypothetical protein [Flavobacterium]|uniref:Uncharacterized protein n=1 Tax=Flavobacterium hankyongi TaxID=1176532 RepID=A0ABP8ZS03_9FLAO|nr:hypothetical protein [Flavobacterium sp. N1846]
MFKEITNRDAWSTIRGFVYQVDMTILRWLDLKDNEVLDLERGEDIDIVENSNEGEELSRKLEQIKYRESSISLNNELTLELLLNFFLHKSNNPTKKVLFRFVTNAKYTKERPSLFTNGSSGISVWQNLFVEDTVKLDDKRLESIKDHLVKKVSEKLIDPAKVEEKDKESQEKWKNFKIFIEDSSKLLSFIKDFEWSTNFLDSDSISENVKKKISEIDILPERVNADILYPRLFLYVFRLLTNKSAKSVNLKVLKAQCLLPSLNQEENLMFEVVSNLLESINKRVFNIENNLTNIENSLSLSIQKIDILDEDIQAIKNSDTVFDVRIKNLSSIPPVEVKKGTTRDRKINEIYSLLEETSWVNFQGINGTGKTHTAILTSKRFDNIHWIELREYNDSQEKSTLLIEAFLSSISNIPINVNRNLWVNDIINQFPPRTIIVINDLPEINNGSSLQQLLVLLASKIKEKQIYLLTTSNYKIPRSLIALLSANNFSEYTDFIFSDEEIKEILLKNEAPDYVIECVNLIALASHRNPQILYALVNRLKTLNWLENPTLLFEDIFNKEFSEEILKDSQLIISSFIKDSQIRELLYRLTLIHWGYRFEEVKAVCDVEGKISSPFEKLQCLVNVWIEESGTQYKTSPLIYDLGVKNLSNETIKSTYSAIAQSILATKKVNVINAIHIISSFIKGENYNSAGIILLKLFNSAQTKETVSYLDNWGYLDFWTSTDFPKNMLPVLKVQLSSEQIRLRKILDKDITVFTEKLRNVSLEAINVSEKLLIDITVLINDASLDVKDYFNRLKFILENFSQIQEPFKDTISVELLEGFLWIPVQQLTTEEQVWTWIELVQVFNVKAQTDFFIKDVAQLAVGVLVGHIVQNEKSNQSFNPKNLATILDRIAKFFIERNFEILSAVILKERIALEFQANKDEAERITIKFSEEFESIEAKYLLYENLGKLFFNDEKNIKNERWLERAIATNCDEQITFSETLAYGAASISETNSLKAVSYLERAVKLLNNSQESSDLDYIQMLSELGIAYWKNNQSKRSYETFADAVSRLFVIKSEKYGPYWIRLLSWMAHALGYISASVAKDKVPEYVADGSNYVKPYQGIFLFNTKDLSDLYTPNKDVLLFAQMAIFSEGIDDISSAYKWSLKAFDETRKIGDPALMMMISTVCNQYPLINFELEVHFEWALQFHVISAYANAFTPEERYDIASKLNFDELLLKRPSGEWNAAEETLISMSVLPMFIMVLLSFSNKEQEANVKLEIFLKWIRNYVHIASNKKLWEDIEFLIVRIMVNKFTPNELIIEANKYGERENKDFQFICILGYIFLETDSIKRFNQIINIFPYLTSIFENAPAIKRNILIPFVKFYSLKAVQDNYVGTREELEEIIALINIETNIVQKLIRPVVETCDITVIEERREWLGNY